jgi:hypothetical protein
LKRLLALLLLGPATLAVPAPAPRELVQAVEFPYYLYPRTLWERELVWLKSIGINTVEFSIPWNWHQIQPGRYDLTGATSPRRDLAGLIKALRRLEMRAWIRPFGPSADWPSPTLEASARGAWMRHLEQLLATQTVAHGGPVAWVEGGIPGVDAAPPPTPVAELSATDRGALAASRDAIAAERKALLWRSVEDELYPGGWAPEGAPPIRKGAVGMSGDEQPTIGALRREGALLRGWGPLLPGLQTVAMPKPAAGKLPEGVTAFEMVSGPASAVCVTNSGAQPFRDELRVLDPGSKRTLVIPNVAVPAGESLWLPVGVSIGPSGLCHECSHFAAAENIVYATAELLAIEYENGILAMEFAAPEPAEAILQLARMPVGPYLAAGKPAEFDWDDKNLRARLAIPAGTGPGRRVRIGIAIEEPETSGFFNEARRLVIGQKNAISTTYSAPAVASRSRLRLPEGFTSTRREKSPNEIDYDVAVPSDALHGDWANLALEADGVFLGRARLQMFRPLSVRPAQGVALRFGSRTELAADPPTVVIDPKAGTNMELVLRNNAPGIQTFQLESSGDGLEFLPPKTEIHIGAIDERTVGLRVFAMEGGGVVRNWRLRVSGGATLDLPMRAVLLPRGRTVAWSADLDGDGSPEFILESQKARAVFSMQDGGRWIEFTWKDGGLNFLPEQGLFAAAGRVDVRENGDALEFTGRGWKRTARLVEGEMIVEQTTPLPPDTLDSAKRGGVSLSVSRPSASSATFKLSTPN